MASVRHETDRGRNGWRLQFRDADKRRRSVWLGEIDEAAAVETKCHVEHLLVVQKLQRPPEPATTKWLMGISDGLRDALSRSQLVECKERREARQLTIGDWTEMYIRERADVKANTVKIFREVKQNLIDYFGEKRLLREVSVADAKQFRVWLATKSNRRDKKRSNLSEATVRRRTGIVKQFWKEAAERGFIADNPFAKLQSGNLSNESRQFFVTHEMIELCMEHCPCTDWMTILALARYGGLRCPSEVLRLRWTDVDLPAGKMIIRAKKTEHHSSGGVRVCPIFIELRPYLERAWDDAEEGAEFVVNRYRSADQNLRTTLEKIITRAGLVPWPRLIQNLRASRLSELLATYPAKDVSSWLGNSVPVAMKHYAMTSDDSFTKAAGMAGGVIGGVIRGAIMGNQGNVTSDVHTTKKPTFPKKSELVMTEDDLCQAGSVRERGLEQSRYFPHETER